MNLEDISLDDLLLQAKKDLDEGRAIFVKNQKVKKCICCETIYVCDKFDFYTLCPVCFNEFDKIKMIGRSGRGPTCETLEEFKNIRKFL